jgi:hypothetical protein
MASQEYPSKRFRTLGDSLAILGVVVAIVCWVLVPTLTEKLVALLVAAALCVYLSYRSHWSKRIPRYLMHLMAATSVVVILGGGGWQLYEERSSETVALSFTCDMLVAPLEWTGTKTIAIIYPNQVVHYGVGHLVFQDTGHKRSWPDTDYGMIVDPVYRCSVGNYGDTALFAVSLKVAYVFRKAIIGANPRLPTLIESGAVIASSWHEIQIQLLENGKPFEFYIQNQAPLWVKVILPKSATLEPRRGASATVTIKPSGSQSFDLVPHLPT